MRRGLHIILLSCLCATSWAMNYAPKGQDRGPVRKGVAVTQLSNQNMQNRVHRAGGVWMNMTNYGFFGNDNRGDANAMADPEYPGVYAPQLEYPGGSGREYLFMGALWVGALIQQTGKPEFPRVSTGVDGWVNPSGRLRGEFFPGEGNRAAIIERSKNLNIVNRLGEAVDTTGAVSQQDFIATYTDTLTESYYVPSDDIDGTHIPLGIKVTQKSYAWSYNYAENFIILDYEIENIASNYLKNVYVGIYLDADVGMVDETDRHIDDITGFQEFYYPPATEGIEYDSLRDRKVINCAWIADNDGRPNTVHSGNDFTVPDVMATRVLRAPNPFLKTSYNWWVSNQNTDLDYGPSWQDASVDGEWPNNVSTAMGDKRKYMILSNREFDFDQTSTRYAGDQSWIDADSTQQVDLDNPTLPKHKWKMLTGNKRDNATRLSNGFDTRFLLSWGPLGILDGADENGKLRYRLNPQEKFWITMAVIMGKGFHNPDNEQLGSTIESSKFRFVRLTEAAAQAASVFDNSMKDTRTVRYPHGDGWFGEDVGADGLYTDASTGFGDSIVIEGIFKTMYPGKDDGEKNGRIDSLRVAAWAGLTEDTHPWYPDRLTYMKGNGVLDAGDGDPDFLGPPPPPAPKVEIVSSPNAITIVWYASSGADDPETFVDPFSTQRDFEGFRLYVSNSGLENDFSFVKQWDKIDFGFFWDEGPNRGTLADYPVGMTQDSFEHLPDSIRFRRVDGLLQVMKASGKNSGFNGILSIKHVPVMRNGVLVDSTYRCFSYTISDVSPLYARYYAITSYDFGDPKRGTEELETAKTATMQHTAPSGTPDRPVGVVPNPYRVDRDYTLQHSGGLSWENQDDGTVDFFPQQDRRMWFYNLPRQCLVRIFTVSGDLVAAIPHNIEGDRHLCTNYDYAVCWNLHNRNEQMVVSGLYLFSVEDKTPGNSGKIQTGKFVIIR